MVSHGELLIGIAGSWSDLIKAALTTSLTRQCIHYILTVKQLTALDMAGITHIEAANLETDRLSVRFRGPGKVHFAALYAKLLEVDVMGPCEVAWIGKVERQTIFLSAMGFYDAPKLESQQAVVRLNGPAQARIWVTDHLDATISGPGRLEYYGAPRVRQKTMPFGGLVSLGPP